MPAVYKLPQMLLSGVVEKYKCDGCNAAFLYGKITNVILKPKFANIQALDIPLEKL